MPSRRSGRRAGDRLPRASFPATRRPVLDQVPDAASGAIGIAVAALCGAAVGTERQWSGHATGPRARLGGIRTFTLLGGVAGIAGWLSATGSLVLALPLLLGAVGLVVVSYTAASRRELEATTEMAALVVIGAGVLCGREALTLGSAAAALTCLLLVEKSRLHALVARLDDVSISSGARFAVMAMVVLPILPEGPYGPLGGVRPRMLWALVLLFAAISFVAYVAQRAIGARRGYVVAGFLGGLVSSTGVTLAFARDSHGRQSDVALAGGVLAACTVMYARIGVALLILAPSLLAIALPALLAPLATGALLLLSIGRRADTDSAVPEGPQHPLQLVTAVQMALLFQLVLFAATFLQERFGTRGVLVSGAALGLTDVDALVVAMATSAARGSVPVVAARAILLGALTNTVVKLALAAVVGSGRFRWRTAGPLAALAAATALGAALL